MLTQYKALLIIVVLVHEFACLMYAKKLDGKSVVTNGWTLGAMMVLQVGVPWLGGFFQQMGFWQWMLVLFGADFCYVGIQEHGKTGKAAFSYCFANTLIYLGILAFGGWFKL